MLCLCWQVKDPTVPALQHFEMSLIKSNGHTDATQVVQRKPISSLLKLRDYRDCRMMHGLQQARAHAHCKTVSTLHQQRNIAAGGG
jgi:hypothetical protein